MSADGSPLLPGGVSAESIRLQSMLDAARREGEQMGRQREEQANLTQRMTAVELDVRETKNSVSEIKTMLAAHFGAPVQTAAPPAAAPAISAGWSGLASKVLDVAKMFMWALVLLAAGMVVAQGGPRASSIIEKTLGQ